MAAEEAIPASSDNVVDPVQDRGWQDAHEDCPLPGPRELPGDEERGAAPAVYPGVTGPIVRQNIKRGQFLRVAAATLDHRPSGCALERREGENGAVIVLEEKLEQTAAQPADSVVEDEVSAFRNRWHSRG